VTGVLALRRQAIERAVEAVHQAQDTAQEGCDRLQSLFPNWQIRTYSTADSPAWGVMKKAGECMPDLTIVGAGGYSSPLPIQLGHIALGTVSQKILTKSNSSVRVGRPLERPKAYPPRLILALDGSPDSLAAMEAIASRQWPQGTEVRVVCALDPRMSTEIAPLIPSLVRWVEDAEEGEDEFAWVYRMARWTAQELRGRGFETSWTVLDSEVKHAVLHEARRFGASCVFLGAKGLVGASGLHHLDRFFLGSTATVIASRAGCSVEVIRAPQDVLLA
jgi:nucleotide-binding universal stress UspA family protein